MAAEPTSEMLIGILEVLPNPVFVKDESHRFVLLNDSCCGFFGYERERLLGKSDYDFFPEEQADVFWKKDDEVFTSGGVNENEEYFTDSAGRQHVILTRKKLYVDRDGRRFLVGVITDITDRKAAEESLRESGRWLRMSQQIARIGHYVFDIQRDHWSSAEALNSIFGIDDTFPRKSADWLRIVHPEDRGSMAEYLADLLAHWTLFDREYRVVNQGSGEVRWVHGLGELERGPSGEPIRLVGTIQDVTDRREVEAERSAMQGRFALASRLAAMGTLVAGVAHEVNNPLAAELAAQGIALEAAREARERLRTGPVPDPKTVIQDWDFVIEALEDAQESGLRIARVVKDLATFASPDPKRTRVRLIDIVIDAMRWLPSYVSQVATIKVEDRGAPDVMASAGHVEQVIVNLITNAARAMPAGRHGEISLVTGAGSMGMARLEVIDQGVGIAAANLDRIFEPFFTTRRGGEGKGTGLGLAISHAIVTANGGTLTVESEVGKGSTFRLELPVAAVDP